MNRLLTFVLCLTAAAFAQSPYGRITGRVVDSAAALVPGTSVRVVNIETNVATTTTTNAEGNFEILNLNPGQYKIIAEIQGFKRTERGPVEVRVGDALTIDI